LSGAAAGAVIGLAIGMLLRPAPTDDAQASAAPVVAPLLPHPSLHSASPSTAVEALSGALPEPGRPEPLAAAAAPAAAPPVSEPPRSAPAAVAPPEPSRFVVKSPEPPPLEVEEEGPYVVKPPDGTDLDALAQAEAAAKRRALAAKKKRRAEALAAQEAASRSQRPIDEIDPYGEQPSAGAQEAVAP
jgi:hypothetical protein